MSTSILYVGGLSAENTASDVKQHSVSIGIKSGGEVTQLSNKSDSRSFKVQVPTSQMELLCESTRWPTSVMVWPFREHRDGLTTLDNDASGERNHKRTTGNSSGHRSGVMSGSDQMSTKVTVATTPPTGIRRTTRHVAMTTTPTLTITKTTTETSPRLANTATNETLKCIKFNCKGLNQSIGYIADMLHSNDIVCLTET